jgi:hypothetical protein
MKRNILLMKKIKVKEEKKSLNGYFHLKAKRRLNLQQTIQVQKV